ncbi:MAG TPA: tetratricopeptide repeat protein [Ignavibacteria bacterium]
MYILKSLSKVLLFVFVLAFVSQINAQNGASTTGDDLITAFKESYMYESKGQFSDAINSLNKVYDKNIYEINLRLGWLYYENKQYQESVQYYQTSINLMPYSVEAKLGIVLPLAAFEDWTKVAEQYISILSIDPNNSSVNYKLGMIYYYKPDYEAAYKCFEKVVNMYPFDYYSSLMFAWSNYQLGKTREAEVLFNKVLLISPDDTSAQEGLALLRK